MQKPYLNLGCGRVILPAEKPAHYGLLPDSLTMYPLWQNIDRNPAPGVDCVVDLFTYPWPLDDNSFDGALLSHLVEHIPHEIRMRRRPNQGVVGVPDVMAARPAYLDQELAEIKAWERVSALQDGWFAFWAELYRVLTPGAMVHVLCPYATSHGFLGDPTHTRPITEQTFQHSMQPDPDAPFEYATGNINFKLVNVKFGVMPRYQPYAPTEADDPITAQQKSEALDNLLHTSWNVVNDLYVKLECVK